MAISPDAIAEFLRRNENPPSYKGLPRDELLGIIRHVSGIDFAPKTEPYAHQIEAVTLAIVRARALLFLGMRLGKTKITLDWASHLRRANLWTGKGLIIVPSPILLTVWEHETKAHSDLKIITVRNKVEDLEKALNSKCDLIAMSWSNLQALLSYKGKIKRQSGDVITKRKPDIETIEFISEFFTLCAIDEIHSIKNHLSLRFQIAEILVSKCRWRLGLTGTPFGRNPLDLWSQAYLIDEGRALSRNFYFFQKAFSTAKKNPFTSSGVQMDFDKRKLSLLQRKIAPMAMSYKLEECRALPPVSKHKIAVSMFGKQREMYEDLVESAIRRAIDAEQARERNDLEDDDAGKQAQGIFVRLRQISSGFLPFLDEQENQHILKFENPKLDWLEDFIEANSDLHMVIFHEFIETGNMICEMLASHKVSHVTLNGRTKVKERIQNLKAFMGGEANFFVVNSASGAMGIDLQIADYQLFFESPVSPIIRQQAEARAMGPKRNGRPLFLDDLLCSPVDRKIVSYIEEGRDLLQSLIHGGAKSLLELRE